MKYGKSLLTSLIAGLCITSAAHAERSYAFSPNNVPKAILLSNTGTATLTFQNSLLPVKFSCYFASATPKGFSASFTSDQDNIDFLTDTNPILESAKNDVQIFTVTGARNRQAIGAVHLQVTNSNPHLKSATIICMMGK